MSDSSHPFSEGLRMMANLATSATVDEVLAETELIGLFLLGSQPTRVERSAEPGVLERVSALEIEGESVGSALVAGIGGHAIAWHGRRHSSEDVELLAPVIHVAQRTLERLVGTQGLEAVPRVARGPSSVHSTLVERITDPVWILDSELRLRGFNSAFGRFLQSGFGVTPAIGASVLSIPEPIRSIHQKIYRGVMKYGPRRMDWAMPDGSVIFDVFMHPMDGGEGVAVTCRDVTEARTATQALEKARAEAERANLAKSAFLAQMSHEIRTPLNAIVGLSDLVLAEELPLSIAGPMERVRLNSRALLHLVAGILDFTRIESGRFEVHPAPMDVRTTLAEAIDLNRDKATNSGLTLTLKVDPGVPERVRSDGDRIRQVLVNLIDNGLKYTAEGGVEVKVVANEMLEIAVRDTGPGIPPADRERVFERFERLSDPRGVGGVGLGLAIAREVAEALGGTLKVGAVEPQGSVFTLALPLEVVRSGVRRDEQTGSVRRPLHILVVDDAPSNLAVTSALLRRSGHRVECLTSGEQVLQQSLEGVDLVLMDVNMPGLDGMETTRHLRERGEDVPIVALTAHAVKEVMASCREAGMQGALVKPIPIATLDEEVLRYARAPRVLLVDEDARSRARNLEWLASAGVDAQGASERIEGEFDAVVSGSDERGALIVQVEEALAASEPESR